MTLRKYNKCLGWLSLFAGTVLLSGCDSALLDPKGQIGLEQRSLILTAFGLMMIVVIPAILMRSIALTGHTPIKWKLWSGRCQF